ncbi:glycosyltransferase family 39 protein [Actinoplanes sp. RD1]|uniref:glycosyltransferase family 39 protein n=1 Tax=Actinoplanes sp. RD1 TaxID=3064538 RepID=UPI002742112C|nr:glycosyltransferase family 39 protein [Actinoplanes sp. RD1]
MTARRVAPLAAGCGAVAAFFLLWNLDRSPDTQYDEVVYSRADQAVAQDWSLTWTNRPLFVHPPLSFLAQAAWLRVRGSHDRPLIDVITDTRLLAALVTVVNVVLIALLTYRLARAAGARTRMVLTGVTALLAATDPVLLRFGRMAMIEPFALLACLVTLHLAMTLHARRSRWFVPAVGLAGGLTLLTNEVGVFMLLTPLVYALLSRDLAFARRCVAALAAALALWSVFVVWAVQLGLLGSFAEAKFVTLQRLLGAVQITGWNRPGVSFLDGLAGQLGQYAASYVVLALGALATLWLLLHRNDDAFRWVFAWLITSYAFGAWTVLLGTLNEQFFVYVIPAALVGTVLVAFSALRVRRWRAGVAWALLALVLIPAGASWLRFSATRNDGLARLTDYVAAHVPPCAALNATGDADRFELLFPGRPITTYATGPGALAHGVTLFVLSDKDAGMRFGTSSPQLNAWVRAHGVRLAEYPSATYRGLSLWQVTPEAHDPVAGVERMPGGDFVVTTGSRCGGHAVTGALADRWTALGGKGMTGPPLTARFSAGAGNRQVFSGVVLTDGPAAAAPLVAALAGRAPEAYRAAGLPPLTATGAALGDPAIAAAARGGLLGSPLGPPATMPGGVVRQAFAGGVLEHAAGSDQVRLSPIGPLLLDAGLVTPPAPARQPEVPPPLPVETEPAQPTSVEPFVWTLAAAVLLHLLISLLVRRRLAPGSAPVSASAGPVARRAVVIRLGALGVMLVLALAARAVLHEEPSPLPALPHAATVLPGVVRTGQPAEADLVRLHEDYGVRAMIAVDGRDDSTLSGAEEGAAAESAGIRFLGLRTGDSGVLSAAQVTAIAEVLRDSPGVVLLHDRTGDGPVHLLAAAVRILERTPAGEVLASTPALSPAQRTALTQLAAAVAGARDAANPYGSLVYR